MVAPITLESYAKELAVPVYAGVQGQAKQDRYSIDITTMVTIVSIMIKVITFIYYLYYGSSDKSAKSIGKMNSIKKFILWRYVRAEAKNKQEANYIYNSLLDTLHGLSEEDKKKLFTLQKR